ncbi:MAG: hypothetical protein ACOZAN_01755 [Patescibacteria group bacterium]
MKKIAQIISLLVIFLSSFQIALAADPSAAPTNIPTPTIPAARCGEITPKENAANCSCTSKTSAIPNDNENVCCGWYRDGGCKKTPGAASVGGVDQETLDNFNPLNIGGSDSDDPTVIAPSKQADNLNTPGKIISRLLDYLFPLAGFVLFFMIVWGGFQMVTGAANKKSMEEGQKRATAAVIGFLLLFSVYWIAQIVQEVLKVNFLG